MPNELEQQPDFEHPDRDYSWRLTRSGEWTRIVFDVRGDTTDCLGVVMDTVRRSAAPKRKTAVAQ